MEEEDPDTMTSREAKWPLIVNLANSIIGVSVLTMPFCMMECGIMLCLLLLWLSNLITRVTCNLLFSAAYMQRARTYEELALSLIGVPGKRLVELLIFLFLASTLCAFFVVLGDLGPHLLAESAGLPTVSAQLRMSFMCGVAIFIILPISLLRNVESLSHVSSLAILFYACFVVRMIVASIPNLVETSWMHEVNWWRPSGAIQCIPILLLSMSCQTQLFVIASSMGQTCNPMRMQQVVSGAVNLCCTVYVLVGLFGYIAFHNHTITGDILILLGISRVTQIIKLAFVLSIAVSFPLMLFPCRIAAYMMLTRTKKMSGENELQSPNVISIPDDWFKALTLLLLCVPLVIAILIPNVEFILGITGSTIGSSICVILPCALYLLAAPQKYAFNRSLAQVIIVVGLFVLIVCSITTLRIAPETVQPIDFLPQAKANINGSAIRNFPDEMKDPAIEENKLGNVEKLVTAAPKPVIEAEKGRNVKPEQMDNNDNNNGRQEPPLPGSAKDNRGDKVANAGNIADEAHKLVNELKLQRQEQKQLIEQQKQIIDQLKAVKDEPAPENKKEPSIKDFVNPNKSGVNLNAAPQVRNEAPKLAELPKINPPLKRESPLDSKLGRIEDNPQKRAVDSLINEVGDDLIGPPEVRQMESDGLDKIEPKVNPKMDMKQRRQDV